MRLKTADGTFDRRGCAGTLITRTNIDRFKEFLGAAMADLEDLLSRLQTTDPTGGFGPMRSRDVLLNILVMTLFVTSNPLTRSGCDAALCLRLSYMLTVRGLGRGVNYMQPIVVLLRAAAKVRCCTR